MGNTTPKKRPSLRWACPALLSLLLSVAAQADFLPNLTNTTVKNFADSFLAPNEGTTHELAAHLESTDPGVIISVGADRAWFAAAQSPNATHLLVLDIDPEIERFHRLNAALMKLPNQATVSERRAQYLRLRLQSSQADWQSLAAAAKNLSSQEKKLLRNPEVWAWWKQKIRDEEKMKELHDLTARKEKHFRGGDYLHGDAEYARVEKLARNDRTQAITVDLNDTARIEKIMEQLEKQKLTVAAMDLSNTHNTFYVKEPNFIAAVESFNAVSTDQTRLILTDRDFKRGKSIVGNALSGYSHSDLLSDWRYFSLPMKDFRQDIGYLSYALRKLQIEESAAFKSWDPFSRRYWEYAQKQKVASNESYIEAHATGLSKLKKLPDDRIITLLDRISGAERHAGEFYDPSMHDIAYRLNQTLRLIATTDPNMPERLVRSGKLSARQYLQLSRTVIRRDRKTMAEWLDVEKMSNEKLGEYSALELLDHNDPRIKTDRLRWLMDWKKSTWAARVEPAMALAERGEWDKTIRQNLLYAFEESEAQHHSRKVLEIFLKKNEIDKEMANRARSIVRGYNAGYFPPKEHALKYLAKSADHESIALLKEITSDREWRYKNPELVKLAKEIMPNVWARTTASCQYAFAVIKGACSTCVGK